MRAIVYTQYGQPDVLSVQDVDEPHAGPGQVRVRVRAAGINPVDWKTVAGAFSGGAALSEATIPGLDVAGVVDQIGEGVDGVSIGQAIFGAAVSGSAAEFAVLEEWAVKPDAVSWEVAGGLNVAGETAVRVLNLLSPHSGDTLIVNGAAGGVGLIVSQIALARGVVVLGTASARNHDALRDMGVRPLEYGDGLVGSARALAPRGVDFAIDTAAKSATAELIELTGRAERVATVTDYNAAHLGVHVTAVPHDRAASLTFLATLVAEAKVRIPIAGTYRLEELAEAYRFSQSGHLHGKLVLIP